MQTRIFRMKNCIESLRIEWEPKRMQQSEISKKYNIPRGTVNVFAHNYREDALYDPKTTQVDVGYLEEFKRLREAIVEECRTNYWILREEMKVTQMQRELAKISSTEKAWEIFFQTDMWRDSHTSLLKMRFRCAFLVFLKWSRKKIEELGIENATA